MSAPGVGFVAALTFKAAVDDPRRFRRSKTWRPISVSHPDAFSRANATIQATYRRPVMPRSDRLCSWHPTPSSRGQASSLRRFGARLPPPEGTQAHASRRRRHVLQC
ncbi:MAG: hypothetical protein CMH69_19360 [Nitratireductor sp.]|nr:hypothetical protein [Nitratireductor sp.]